MTNTTPCASCGGPLDPGDTECSNCALPVNLNAAMNQLNQGATGGGPQTGGVIHPSVFAVGPGGPGNFFGGHGPVTADTEKKVEDALQQMPSLKDRNDDFLKSIGADPAKAALGPTQARRKISELMDARGEQYEEIHFMGNSLGIDEIRIIEQVSCSICGGTYLEDEDYDDNSAPSPGQKWCSNDDQWVTVTSSSKLYSRKEADWIEWKRIWETLRKDYGDKFKVGQPSTYDEKMREYLVEAASIEGDPIPDLMDLIEGMDVRLEAPDGQNYYARVWEKNPLDENQVPVFLNLQTMQPMTVTRDWRVQEVV